MAGMHIKIDIDNREVKHALERLLRRTGDLSDPMREIAEVLLGSTRGGISRRRSICAALS